MESQHTPGPWTFDGEYVEALDLDHPESICTINGDHVKANARLIAAAPELLAALIESQAALHHANPSSVRNDVRKRNTPIIAQAQGGSP